jgi:hypothetical protein
MIRQSSPAAVEARNRLIKKFEQTQELDEAPKEIERIAAWDEFDEELGVILNREIADADERKDQFDSEMDEAREHLRQVGLLARADAR